MLSTISKRNTLSSIVLRTLTRAMSSNTVPAFKTLSVSQEKPFVFHVQLNRPDKLNSLNKIMWSEITECFNGLSDNPDCRAIVVSAAGKIFTAGLDLKDAMSLGQDLAQHDDVARKGRVLEKNIKAYQQTMSSLESCRKPVITAVHSACVGAGVDLITAADVRYCTEDAWFSVMEVDIGMAADVGTLQRLPKVINSQSLVRELCFTGRKLGSKEALQCGLVSRTFKTKEELITEAINLAEIIASKSPVAVQATKQNLVYSLDHTTQEGLDHICELNKMLLQSEDFVNACIAQATKGDKPVFAKL